MDRLPFKDPSLPMQKSIFDILRGGLPGNIGVHDEVPVDAAGKVIAKFPYVHIGEDQIVTDVDQFHRPCAAYATLHVWSREPGKVEAKSIMAQCLDLLDRQIPIEDFRTISARVDTGPQHMSGGDGRSSHSVATMRYQLEPLS